MPLRLPPQIRTVRTRLRLTVAAEPAPRSFPRAAPLPGRCVYFTGLGLYAEV